MAVLDKLITRPKAESLFVSEAQMDEFRAIVARQFEELGIDFDPNATAEDARNAMLADGIRPEDNFLSRAIIAAREE